MNAIEMVTHRPRSCQDSSGVSQLRCVALHARLMFTDSATELVAAELQNE